MTQQALLSVKDLHLAYGGIKAVRGINIDVYPGELVTLIGSNGAGKTSTLKAITGMQSYQTGEILYQGENISASKQWDLPAKGLVMVPEGRGMFSRMTITENMQMGAFLRNDKQGIADDVEKMFTIFPRLKERANQLAGTMSGGEQQMLAMARAIMAQPKLLILDEPTMGLSPVMTETIFEVINQIHSEGVTIILVTQQAIMALEAADRGYVMATGSIVAHGNAKDLLVDPKVREAYLGA